MPKLEELKQVKDLKLDYLGRCCTAAEKACDEHTPGRHVRLLATKSKACEDALKLAEKANEAYAMMDPVNYSSDEITLAHARVSALQDKVKKYEELYEDEMEHKKKAEFAAHGTPALQPNVSQNYVQPPP